LSGQVRYAKKLAGVDCQRRRQPGAEIAGEKQLAAIVAEEPATVLFAGMMNNNTPKAGATYAGNDSMAAMQNPKQFYTPELQRFTRDKVRDQVPGPDRAWRPAPDQQRQRADRHSGVEGGRDRDAGDRLQRPRCFGFGGDQRIDAAADLFVKIQEFLEPRLKTKPTPVDAGLIRQVPLIPATAWSPKKMSDKSTYNSENFPSATNYIAVANFY
jgi:hypothetical protein